MCDPLIQDAKGDVDNPAIDIIESSITYDASRNTLVIRHVIDDIPASNEASEDLLYDLDFDLEAMTYHAMAYIGPLEGAASGPSPRSARTAPSPVRRTNSPGTD